MKLRSTAALTASVLAAGALVAVTPPAQAAVAGYVALTFDDGPSGDNTRRLLSLLQQKNTRATFFLRGDQVAADPALALATYRAGHDIGNHSYTHPALSTLSDDAVRSELQRTNDALAAAGIPRPSLWRPPFGEVDDRLKAIGDSFGMSQVVFDNVPADYEGGPKAEAQYICDFVVAHAQDQSIVLQHDFVGGTVDAVPCIVDGLRARGLEPGRLVPSATQGPLSSSFARVVPWDSPSPSSPTPFRTVRNPVLDRDNYYATRSTDAWINSSVYQTAYFKFDLTGAGPVTSAKLRLYRANTESGQVTVDARRVDDDNWSDSGPLPAVGPVVGRTTAPAARGWIELDVSDYVRGASGDQTLTIAVTSSSVTWTSFHSADNGADKPELVLN
ncbi:polysaccharide deacetylase family protein [Micromonospora sp. NPDC051300]|uniref:polysaccharide deacetylase family protein n=1 Tax=Micromonospora sp. NPDC051300 TaxID=3364286 RepID=UPI0037A15AEC